MKNTDIEISPDNEIVSVIIPCFNHEQYVAQALGSVTNQTYRKIEIIIIDDFSSDKTYNNIIDFISHINTKHNIIVKRNEENLGICKTLNLGLSLASGRWIALLASDDLYHENFIQCMVTEALKYETDEIVIHCDAIMIDKCGKILGSSHDRSILEPLSEDCFWDIAEGKGKIVPITMFVSRSLYDKVGEFDEKLKAEDYDMHLRMARIAKYVFINKCLAYSRITPGSLGKNVRTWARDVFSALDKHMYIDPIRIERIKKERYKIIISKLAFESDIKHALIWSNEYRLQYKSNKILLLIYVYMNYIKGILWRAGLRRPAILIALRKKYFK